MKKHKRRPSERQRLANRAADLRRLFRARRDEIQRMRVSPRAAKLIEEIVGLAAWYRLQPAAWDDVYESDHAAVVGATAAALLVAIDCGMSRGDYVAWLRRTADQLGKPTTTTKGAQQ